MGTKLSQYLSHWDNCLTYIYIYILYINLADLFNDIFPLRKARRMETSLWIDQEIPGLWLGYKISFCKNKQTKNLAKNSNVASKTTWWTRGGGNQAHSRKKKKLTHSNYFYIEESIPCTNFVIKCTSLSQDTPFSTVYE